MAKENPTDRKRFEPEKDIFYKLMFVLLGPIFLGIGIFNLLREIISQDGADVVIGIIYIVFGVTLLTVFYGFRYEINIF